MDFPKRFADKFERRKPDDCWLWGAGCFKSGYGQYWHKKQSYAHRFAWECANGPIPDGLCVCHTCDVRRCVNPAHMFLGTDGDNTEDKVKKGRQTRGETNIHKLTSEEVLEIRRLLREGLYQHVIARQFGISQSVVSEIKNRKAWAHL